MLVTLVAISLVLVYPHLLRRGGITLKIFYAGSLTLALKDATKAYEALSHGVSIITEGSGSVQAVRKITDLGKNCDIIMVADYKLIRKYLIPKYADWCLAFCSNKIVLCYTNNSRYSDMINGDNWYKVLLMPGVKVGFSNPTLDPCGYRALSILYLSSLAYNCSEIWDELVKRHLGNLKVKANSTGHYIYLPRELSYIPGGKLVLRSKSVDLIGLLEGGMLDYAFEYKSVAREHGLRYVELPSGLNLAEDPPVKVFIVLRQEEGGEKVIRIEGIKYGVTVLKDSRNFKEAVKFLRWLLRGQGKRILADHGFKLVALEPMGNVPAELRG